MTDSGKKIYSILGDSVSTFSGYTPAEAVFYDAWTQRAAGLSGHEDTWWMQVIRGMGGLLGVNNSYAGSLVSGHQAVSGTSKARIKQLGGNGTPDVILVAMGGNDWAYGVLPQDFEREYRRMLQRLKARYPETEIWCGTLLMGKPAEIPEDSFFNLDSVISPKIYSDIIRKIAGECGMPAAELDRYDMEYDTIDGVHPNKTGMEVIADLWLRELRKG